MLKLAVILASTSCVTGVADTFDGSSDKVAMSLRDAIHQSNITSSPQEIWLPAWKFVLARDRATYGQGSATDTSVSFGDLDIDDSLTIRGVTSSTSVAWRVGVVDAVFDLLGDYNGDGIANGTDNGNVGTEDYVIWQNTLGSTSDLRADGDDDGIVDQGDYGIWTANWGNTLSLLGVS
jgi:hypothetical protein